DTLLLFEIALALLCLVRAVRARSQAWQNGAFVCVVLATMTKVVGIFFLPWLVLTQAQLAHAGRPGCRRRLATQCGRAVLSALGIISLTTPRLLVDAAAFFNALQRQARENSAGHGSEAPVGWLSVLVSPQLVGLAATAVFVLWIASYVAWAMRRRGARL